MALELLMKRADAVELYEVTFEIGRSKRTELKLEKNRRDQPGDPFRPDAPQAKALHVLTGQVGDRAIGQFMHGVIPRPRELLRHNSGVCPLILRFQEPLEVRLSGLVPRGVHHLSLADSKLQPLRHRNQGAQ